MLGVPQRDTDEVREVLAMGQEARTTLGDVLEAVAREQGQGSVENIHRGGTAYLVKQPRLTPDQQAALSPEDGEELRLAVGAIVQRGPEGAVTYRLYRSEADLDADWARTEELRDRAAPESGGRGE
jgi:hypothetical protein